MSLDGHPARLARYTDLLRLIARHGGADLVASAGLTDDLPEGAVGEGSGATEARSTADADAFARDLEALGPTFVKLGQLLATRADLLGEDYRAALERLEDDVAPTPFDAIRDVIEDELGARVTRVYADIDPDPIASASLAQVHAARLRDGRRVAVKVQRPGVRRVIREDLEVLTEVAELLEAHTDVGRRYRLGGVVDQFRRSLLRELDFRREAHNLVTLRRNLDHYRHLRVPAPVDDLSTGRVLTMELVEGRKVTEMSPLTQLDLDTHTLADELFAAYLQQILADGFVHADPHPGNVLLTDDGRLALVDVGMTVRLQRQTRERLLKLLLAVSDGEAEQAADTAIALGEVVGDVDERRLRHGVAQLVGRFHDLPPGEVQVGRILLEVARLSAETGVQPPVELTLLARTLLHLDTVGRTLDEDFDTNDAIRRHASQVMTAAMVEELKPSSALRTALDAKELVEAMPGRLNEILGALADGEFSLRVEAVDEQRLEHVFQKLANRVAAGLVLSSFVVGAAMLMRVETAATLFGYPALAMVFFLLAALGGVVLIVLALRSDERPD